MAIGVEMLKEVEEGGAVKEESGGVCGGGGGNGVHEFKKVMVAVRAKRSGGGEKVDAEVTFMTPVGLPFICWGGRHCWCTFVVALISVT